MAFGHDARWISRSATWLAIMCACLQSSASASDLPYRRLEVVVGLSRPSLSTLARSEASALRGQHPLIEARNPFQAGVQRRRGVRTTYARPAPPSLGIVPRTVSPGSGERPVGRADCQ